jgi:hypothetical protein
VVGHLIRPHQLERDWIVRRSYRLGRHMFHMEQPELPQDIPRWRGAPRWKYREWLDHWVGGWRGRLFGDFSRTFVEDVERSFVRGYIDEAARQTATARNA